MDRTVSEGSSGMGCGVSLRKAESEEEKLERFRKEEEAQNVRAALSGDLKERATAHS